MPVEEKSPDQFLRLAAYVRQNPAGLGMNAEELSAATGVSVDLALKALTAPRLQAQEQKVRRRRFRDAWLRMGLAVDRLEPRMTVISAAVWVLTACALYFGTIKTAQNSISIQSIPLAFMLLVSGVGLNVLYFRFARARHAVFGGIACFLAFTVIGLPTILIRSKDNANAGELFLMVPFAFSMLSVMIMALGAMASVFGGYRRLLGESHRRTYMSRQQLLDRLFEVEARLEHAVYVAPELEPQWLVLARKYLLLFAMPIGFLVAIVIGVITGLMGVTDQNDTRALPVAVIALASMGLQAGLAYLGGRPIKGMLVSALYSVAGWFSYFPLLAIAFFTGQNAFSTMTGPRSMGVAGYLWSLAVSCIVGLVSGMGAQIQGAAERNKKLRENDPEALLAEFFEIQTLLNPTAGMKTVVVIDAAASSRMKANADALLAEWSFRAYQEFLQKIVEANKGIIHSTAGDGAVALFDDVPMAYRAAQQIQTEVDDFNQTVNRLKDPFRLRIGIHCDRIAGDLNQVQFAAVIDIAAHVEGVSQIGGIAVTEAVASQLPDHVFASLPQPVDGQQVLVALRPQLESQ